MAGGSESGWMREALEKYAQERNVRQKGYLCVGLVVTRHARNMAFPLDETDLLAESGAQVRGLGRGAVQKILADHGIDRVLAKEGGRTSRGSLPHMREYVTFLNSIADRDGFDLLTAERWWIEQVLSFFASKPFLLRVKATWSLRRTVRDVLDQAEARQGETEGTMLVGAVMQHLVGAKLEFALGENLVHYGFSVADEPSDRPGDFAIGDVAVHVTKTPTEALIRKCRDNVDSGLRPLIITSRKGAEAAEVLAELEDLQDSIDVLEIEQFLATNIYEASRFEKAAQRPTTAKLVARYNAIVDAHETDPGLRIKIT